MDNTGGHYFPFTDETIEMVDRDSTTKVHTTYDRGPTLLDEFAKAALTGFCANVNCFPERQTHFDALAEDAYRAARAMLQERAK